MSYSKISMPAVNSTVISRERLMQLLNAVKSEKLIIVRAPAGYGKTTLLSQWVSQCNERSAWVSLDYSDNDPIRFWQYISKAIGTAMQTNLYERLSPLFSAQPRISTNVFVDIIRADVNSSSSKIQLILDDYEAITHSIIHRSITRLIEYLPKNLRVIISSRSELPLPLLRWKGESLVKEINTRELKFTYKETVHYLKEKSLTSYDLNTLHEIYKKSEGWPASIKLAASIYGDGMSKYKSSDEFSGKDPFVSDYLFHELLSTLSVEEKKFLMEISVFKYLESNLCTELTGNTESERILSSFEEKGLFINKWNGENPIYKYHPLFGDLLIQELRIRNSPEKVKSLYSKAAHILLEKEDYMSAIETAMRGEVYDKAISWIDEYILEGFSLGQTETLVKWIDVLLMRNQSLSLSILIMHAFALAMINEHGRALQVINELESQNELNQWLEKEGNQAVASDFFGVKAYVLQFDLNDIESSMPLLLKQFKLQKNESKLVNNPISYNKFNPVLLRTSFGRNGRLWSEEKNKSFYKIFKHSNYKKFHLTGYNYGILAETLVEHNHLDEALPKIEEAVRIGYQYNDPGLVIPMLILHCQIEMSRQSYREVNVLLEQMKEFIAEVGESQWMESIYAMKAMLYLQQNKLDEAEHELNKIQMTGEYIGGVENEFWWFVYVRLLIKKKEYVQGLKTIAKMKGISEENEQITTILEASLLKTIIYTCTEENRLAYDLLHETFEYGYQYGYVRVFLNEPEIYPLIQSYMKLRKRSRISAWATVPISYIESIIAAFNLEKSIIDIPAEKENPLKELTPRELEVLQLLTTGLSNRNIAEKLFLSTGTVRIYLSNIYVKLNVNSRTQAVIIAKEHKIGRI